MSHPTHRHTQAPSAGARASQIFRYKEAQRWRGTDLDRGYAYVLQSNEPEFCLSEPPPLPPRRSLQQTNRQHPLILRHFRLCRPAARPVLLHLYIPPDGLNRSLTSARASRVSSTRSTVSPWDSRQAFRALVAASCASSTCLSSRSCLTYRKKINK